MMQNAAAGTKGRGGPALGLLGSAWHPEPPLRLGGASFCKATPSLPTSPLLIPFFSPIFFPLARPPLSPRPPVPHSHQHIPVFRRTRLPLRSSPCTPLRPLRCVSFFARSSELGDVLSCAAARWSKAAIVLPHQGSFLFFFLPNIFRWLFFLSFFIKQSELRYSV